MATSKGKKATSEHSRDYVRAYKEVPRSLRKFFIKDFAAAHHLAESTVKQKVCGVYDVNRSERDWAVGYNPYTRESSVQYKQFFDLGE